MIKSPLPVLPNSGAPAVVRTARMGCLPGSEFPRPRRWDAALSGRPSSHRTRTTKRGRRASCGSCMQPALLIVVPAHCEKRGLGYGAKTSKPRRVSAILRPSTSPDCSIETTAPLTGTAPLLWRDCSRCQTRREWMRLLRSQRLDLLGNPEPVGSPPTKPSLFSRAKPRPLAAVVAGTPGS